MSGIETYGGKCPNCEKNMLQKWDSSNYAFMYEACPWCGFAYGQVGPMAYTPEEVWDSIFEHFHIENREELISRLNLQRPISEFDSDFYPTLFQYTTGQISIRMPGTISNEIQSYVKSGAIQKRANLYHRAFKNDDPQHLFEINQPEEIRRVESDLNQLLNNNEKQYVYNVFIRTVEAQN